MCAISIYSMYVVYEKTYTHKIIHFYAEKFFNFDSIHSTHCTLLMITVSYKSRFIAHS